MASGTTRLSLQQALAATGSATGQAFCNVRRLLEIFFQHARGAARGSPWSLWLCPPVSTSGCLNSACGMELGVRHRWG